MKKPRTKLEVTERSKAGRLLLRALELGQRSPPINPENREASLREYRDTLEAVGAALRSDAHRHGWRP